MLQRFIGVTGILAGMCILLILLMSYQITGQMLHEYIGMAVTILVVIHQILNIKWYKSLFKGKYNLNRFLTITVNILLIASFILTAFCGMAMSNYAVPFLYGIAQTSFVRRMHLAMSHWSFVLMGIHLGLHIPVIFAKYKVSAKTKNIVYALSLVIAVIGLYLFISNGMYKYILFKEAFAFFDYDKPALLVFIENIMILISWVFIASQAMELIQKKR